MQSRERTPRILGSLWMPATTSDPAPACARLDSEAQATARRVVLAIAHMTAPLFQKCWPRERRRRATSLRCRRRIDRSLGFARQVMEAARQGRDDGARRAGAGHAISGASLEAATGS